MVKTEGTPLGPWVMEDSVGPIEGSFFLSPKTSARLSFRRS